MANNLRKSLKLRLFVIFFGVSLLSVSILGVFAYFTSKQSLQQAIISGYRNINSIAETAVVHIIDAAHEKYSLLHYNRFLSESVEKVLAKDPNSQQLLKEVGQTLIGFKAENPDAQELFIIKMSGQVLVSSLDSHVGADESLKEYFVRGKSGVNMMDVYYSDRIKIVGFVISGPLYAEKSKEILAVFAIRFDMGNVEKIVCDYTGMADTAETFIVNRDGLMLTSSRFAKDAVLEQKVDTGPVRLWQAQKKQMEGVYTNYDGRKVLGCSGGEKLAKAYGDLNWMLMTNVDAQEAFAPVRRLGLMMALIGISISIAAALGAYFIAKSISNPIVLVAQIAKKVGEGDLTMDMAETKSEDEIGILSRSFKQMIISLKTIILRVAEVAERVSASGQEVASSAQEMNATTEEVASTIQEISKGTETQAQKVEETHKVIDGLAASILAVSQGAQEAVIQAAKATETAKKGGDAAKEAQGKLMEIAETVTSSVDTVKKLGNRSDQMGEIVNVIANIADQTNLLALNAAIEAARAGEYGRGFAVVAEEVRKLAEGSAKAADQIGKLIRDVQKETTQAVASIESAAKDADVVGNIAQRLAEGLIEIIKNSEVAVSAAERASVASQQQSAGTEQASKSVAAIAVLAEENASATEEAAASTEEMTASMEEMSASAQELADLGIKLGNIVSQFKLDEESIRAASSSVQRMAEKQTLRPAKLGEQAEATKRKMAELKNNQRDTARKAKLSRQSKIDTHS